MKKAILFAFLLCNMAASAQLRVFNGTFTWERRNILEQVMFATYDTDQYTINDVEVVTTTGARIYKSYYQLGLKAYKGHKTSITTNPSKVNCSLYSDWVMFVTYDYQGRTYKARYTKSAGDIEPCEIFDNHYWDCMILSTTAATSPKAEKCPTRAYNIAGVQDNGGKGIIIMDGRKMAK